MSVVVEKMEGSHQAQGSQHVFVSVWGCWFWPAAQISCSAVDVQLVSVGNILPLLTAVVSVTGCVEGCKCCLSLCQVDLAVQEKEKYVNVTRWFDHVQHRPGLRHHLPPVVVLRNSLYTSGPH